MHAWFTLSIINDLLTVCTYMYKETHINTVNKTQQKQLHHMYIHTNQVIDV